MRHRLRDVEHRRLGDVGTNIDVGRIRPTTFALIRLQFPGATSFTRVTIPTWTRVETIAAAIRTTSTATAAKHAYPLFHP